MDEKARPRSRQRRPLTVEHHEHVESIDRQRRILDANGTGWYVEVWEGGRYVAIVGLCFKRETDATIAAASLTQAGLISINKLKRAGGAAVKRIACENLQW